MVLACFGHRLQLAMSVSKDARGLGDSRVGQPVMKYSDLSRHILVQFMKFHGSVIHNFHRWSGVPCFARRRDILQEQEIGGALAAASAKAGNSAVLKTFAVISRAY